MEREMTQTILVGLGSILLAGGAAVVVITLVNSAVTRSQGWLGFAVGGGAFIWGATLIFLAGALA
jgi:hypothetical protein